MSSQDLCKDPARSSRISKVLKIFSTVKSFCFDLGIIPVSFTRSYKILEKFDAVDRIFKDLTGILTNIIARIFRSSLLGSFNILFERRILQDGEYFSNV